MVNINLIYFGSVTDVTGTTAETVEAPATLDELSDWLLSRFPYQLPLFGQPAAHDRQPGTG